MNKQLLRLKIQELTDGINQAYQSRDELRHQLALKCGHPKLTIGTWGLNEEQIICQTCGTTWSRGVAGWYDMKYHRNISSVDCRADFDKWRL